MGLACDWYVLLADVVEARRSRRVNGRCISEMIGQTSSHDGGYVLNYIDEVVDMRPLSLLARGRSGAAFVPRADDVGSGFSRRNDGLCLSNKVKHLNYHDWSNTNIDEEENDRPSVPVDGITVRHTVSNEAIRGSFGRGY